MKKFSSLFKSRLSISVIGKSRRNRDILLLKTGRGDKKFLLLSAIHGREFVSTAFAMRSLWELLSDSSSASDEILKASSLYICPMINPDGVEIALGREILPKGSKVKSELYKNNANNVNLNANFPFLHRKVPMVRQGGFLGGSQPETKSVISLCRKVDFDAAVSLHARGNCTFWRDSFNGAIYGDYLLAEKLFANCGFKMMKPTAKPVDFSGGFENWFRHKFRRPAVCVELAEDESLSFAQLCTKFDEAVLWNSTKSFLRTFLQYPYT